MVTALLSSIIPNPLYSEMNNNENNKIENNHSPILPASYLNATKSRADAIIRQLDKDISNKVETASQTEKPEPAIVEAMPKGQFDYDIGKNAQEGKGREEVKITPEATDNAKNLASVSGKNRPEQEQNYSEKQPGSVKPENPLNMNKTLLIQETAKTNEINGPTNINRPEAINAELNYNPDVIDENKPLDALLIQGDEAVTVINNLNQLLLSPSLDSTVTASTNSVKIDIPNNNNAKDTNRERK